MHRSICFSVHLDHGVEGYSWHTWRCEFQRNPFFAFLTSRNHSPNSVFLGDLFLHVNGLCFRMFWRRIAAAAAAAFRGGRGYPYRGGNGFPMHAWRFNLRFVIVRVLWSLPVIHHDKFGRFETHIIEVFFLHAQRGTVVHNVIVVTMNSIHKSFVTTTLSKYIRNILVYSVMVLELQFQEHQ